MGQVGQFIGILLEVAGVRFAEAWLQAGSATVSGGAIAVVSATSGAVNHGFADGSVSLYHITSDQRLVELQVADEPAQDLDGPFRITDA